MAELASTNAAPFDKSKPKARPQAKAKTMGKHGAQSLELGRIIDHHQAAMYKDALMEEKVARDKADQATRDLQRKLKEQEEKGRDEPIQATNYLQRKLKEQEEKVIFIQQCQMLNTQRAMEERLAVAEHSSLGRR